MEYELDDRKQTSKTKLIQASPLIVYLKICLLCWYK